MKDSLVSIVMPAFNAAQFIEASIESVRSQTLVDWQLLVIDDSSTDETARKVAAVAERDPRITLLTNRNARGPANARNAGLDAAVGEYIAFLDSDDQWRANKLEQQLRFMQTTQSNFSCTAFRRISADGSITGRKINVPTRIEFKDLLRNTAIATSSVIVRRRVVGPRRFTPGLKCDDYTLFLDLLRSGLVAHGLNQDLMIYRVTKNSVSRNKLTYAREVWRLYRQHLQLSPVAASWYFTHYALNATAKYLRF